VSLNDTQAAQALELWVKLPGDSLPAICLNPSRHRPVKLYHKIPFEIWQRRPERLRLTLCVPPGYFAIGSIYFHPPMKVLYDDIRLFPLAGSKLNIPEREAAVISTFIF
jgi:hypothetical protein